MSESYTCSKHSTERIFSSSFPVRYGVPTGSVLGPLLFILYVNYVLNLTQGRTIMYADDISILNTGQDIK
jgi:hypothetical protein